MLTKRSYFGKKGLRRITSTLKTPVVVIACSIYSDKLDEKGYVLY